MTRKGPLITLLGGGALGAVLLAASISAASGDDDDAALAAGDGTPTAEAATPEPEEAETPEPSEPPEEVDPETYVGYVDGGGASVAIVVRDDEAVAYVCDGDTVEAWLEGPAINGDLVLEGEDGELLGSYDAETATGDVTVDDTPWTFSVDLVEQPEGLYRVADTVVGGAEVDGGWIVLPGGEVVGVLTEDGEPGPAPAIDPATGEVRIDDERIVADRVG